jgi:diaminopropionate ammonia-lyase
MIEPTKAICLYYSANAQNGLPHDVEAGLDTIMAGLACGEPTDHFGNP